MREKIKDKGRLEHILNAINTLLTYKDRYIFEDTMRSNNHENTLFICLSLPFIVSLYAQ